MGRAVMIQGTGSNVGKSLLVAGLVRAARARGIDVAPFKPQNMSNNAAVTADGGRDRARAGPAGAGGGAGPADRHEPGPAEARDGYGRAGRRAGKATDAVGGRGLRRIEGAVDGPRAGKLRTAEGGA